MKLRFIFLIATVVFVSGGHAQQSTETYKEMADGFFKEAKYSAAIDVYERILYFEGDKYSKSIYLPLAKSYTATGNYEKASVNYNNAFINAKDDSLKYDIIFESTMNYMLMGDTSLAYNELLNIPETVKDDRVNNKYHLLMGTLDYKSGRYNRAERHLLSIKGSDSSAKANIQAMPKKARKINKRYNPNKVQWMSIVPGLGQAWCGYYDVSANAIILDAALAVLFIHVSLKYTLLDGILAVYPWLNRYYKGGIVKSYKLAEKKRDAERNKLYNKILRSLPPIN